MRLNFNLKKRLKILCYVLIFLVSLIFQTDSQKLRALDMENYQNRTVVEELRLRVPSQYKEVWLETEKKIWDPWLSSKDGFLGRQLFWNKEKEEALILVNWKNKKLWKSISMTEVNEIQAKFEDNVKTYLNLNENPFKLIYEGELGKEG
tara:strand:+ start:1381 stop:1827 length:447 start_codon:yes stop_codon:yes gene_type:complete